MVSRNSPYHHVDRRQITETFSAPTVQGITGALIAGPAVTDSTALAFDASAQLTAGPAVTDSTPLAFDASAQLTATVSEPALQHTSFTLLALSSASSVKPTPLPPSAVPAREADRHNIAAIVTPPVIVLLAAGLIFLLWRRRWANSQDSAELTEQRNDSHLIPTPFPNKMLGGQSREDGRRLSPPVSSWDGSEISDMPPSYHTSLYDADSILLLRTKDHRAPGQAAEKGR
ncbi:hypothetical protein CPC08DRAFT_711129 [Agrocybe pediades]|nr:hypothetical protein CPC08DRAFT_711129 [Agrocybe pediades]